MVTEDDISRLRKEIADLRGQLSVLKMALGSQDVHMAAAVLQQMHAKVNPGPPVMPSPVAVP